MNRRGFLARTLAAIAVAATGLPTFADKASVVPKDKSIVTLTINGHEYKFKRIDINTAVNLREKKTDGTNPVKQYEVLGEQKPTYDLECVTNEVDKEKAFYDFRPGVITDKLESEFIPEYAKQYGACIIERSNMVFIGQDLDKLRITIRPLNWPK